LGRGLSRFRLPGLPATLHLLRCSLQRPGRCQARPHSLEDRRLDVNRRPRGPAPDGLLREPPWDRARCGTLAGRQAGVKRAPVRRLSREGWTRRAGRRPPR
jgi:hypothetical protein